MTMTMTMTMAEARRRVLKALAAVGCRNRRNDHNILDVEKRAFASLHGCVAFCNALAGNSRSGDLLFMKLAADGTCARCYGRYWLVNPKTEKDVRTIGDFVEAVRAAYPL